MTQPINELNRTKQKHTVQIRKKNRQQQFRKIRKLEAPDSQQLSKSSIKQQTLVIVDPRYAQEIEKFISEIHKKSEIPELSRQLLQGDIMAKHRAIISIRRIISKTQNDPPLQAVIDIGIVPFIIDCMKQTQYPQMRLQACWILTNIASGTPQQCQFVVQKGPLDVFIKLLQESNDHLIENAIWAIGNIGGDNAKFRNDLTQKGAVHSLVKIVNDSKNKKLIIQASWALANLCRGTPIPDYKTIKEAIPVLCKVLLADILDIETISDCLWAISYHCQQQKSRIMRVTQTGIVPKLIQFIQSPFITVLVPALRIVGNISAGNQLHTQSIIQAGMFECVHKLLQHGKKSIRRQCCWILSNISAGVKSQVNQFLSRTDLVEKILNIFGTDDIDVRLEICYIFSNLSRTADTDLIYNFILKNEIIAYFFVIIMQDQNLGAVETALGTLYDLLVLAETYNIKNGVKVNMFIKAIQDIPGSFDRLEHLQHKTEGIYKNVVRILEKFFSLESAGQVCV